MARRKKANTGTTCQERAIIDATLGRPVAPEHAALAADVQAIKDAGGVVDIPGEIAAPTRPPLKLIGTDGNAFAILGRAQRAAKRAGWTGEQWEAFRADATSGNYDHLLHTVMTYFDVH